MKPATPERNDPPAGTILAFDFGEKRIGVAVGEWLLQQAHPLTTIHAQTNDQRFASIAALIEKWQPRHLVVGRPTSLEGAAHAMTVRCERFADQLHRRFGLQVALADERLSSFAALDRLRETGHRSRQAKQVLDAMAAQVILQNYLDDVASGSGCPHPQPDLPA